MKRRTFFLRAIALIFVLGLAGCATQSPSPQSTSRIPVIFDADIGDDIDDTWALGYLLRCPELDLKLVVGDNGKPEYRAKLFAKFLEVARRSDVPIGIGLDVNPKKSERQALWIKDYDLEKYPGTVHRDGVQAIIDTVMKSPRPITIIAVGPVQNLAEALKREPRIAERARIVGMHGSVRVGYGGDKKISAEYNVKTAPAACQTVFTAPWDITITPLDTCDKLGLSGDKYQQVFRSHDPIASAIVTNYCLWADARGMGSPDAFPTRSTTLFDVVAVYLAYGQDWCSMEDIGIRVTDEGFTIEDSAAKKMSVAISWKNLPALEDQMVKRLTAPP